MNEKTVKTINGCDLGSLKIGGNATINIGGQIFKTSPIVQYIVAGGTVIVETKNSIYTNEVPKD